MWENIDKRRLLLGVALLLGVFAGAVFWAKDTVPRFLAERRHVLQETQSKQAGSVAGLSDVRSSLEEDIQEQIGEIKKNIAEIKTEDLKDQEAVKKILKDLDGISQKASESAKVLDVKGNLCEEAKKRFCE